MRKSKRKTKYNDRNQTIAIVSIVSFAIAGIAALVVGYGLQDGWASVLAWFSSRWAVYVYIAAAILALLLVWVIHQSRMGE